MEGFDKSSVFLSVNFGADEQHRQQGTTNLAIKKRFKEYLRQFNKNNFPYKYRDGLKQNYNLRQYWIKVNLEDLSSFDDTLTDKLYKSPAEMIPLFEEAATEVADKITSPRPEGEEDVEKVQVMLYSEGHPTSIRNMSADMVSRLVKIQGIVIVCRGIRAKASTLNAATSGCLLGAVGFTTPAGH